MKARYFDNLAFFSKIKNTSMFRFLSILIFLLFSTISNAVTYYVSPTGNDSNNGTSTSTPWQTISRANTFLNPGDVILFQREGTYRGHLYINQSGTTGNPITIGAYGSGKSPVFLGSRLTTNWIVHQGNIWKTTISATRIAHLFYSDSLLPIARFPNTGWLRNDSGSPTRINDSELTQSSGYFNGSTVVVRSSGWSYDTATVTSYTPGQLNFNNIYYNLSTSNWGYFLRNKFEFLDAPGEWFYDRATSTLYLYPISPNPNTERIEVVSAFLAGDGCGISVNWQRNNVVIENIEFKHYGYAGVSTSGSTGITVRNCTFDQCDEGIRAYGNSQTFSNNGFTRCRQIGINSQSGGTSPSYGNNNLLENNTITDCAIYPGLGKSNWGYFGLNCQGTGNIVRGNRLTRIGYIGISFSGNCLVENNVIERACYILNDGSGIAFDNTDGAIVRSNIVLYTLGNTVGPEGSCATNFDGCDPKGKGIYFGNISNKNNIIEDNTTAYCNGAGIWFDHTMVQSGNQIRNNTCFGNNLYQFGASDYSNYNGPGATSPYAIPAYPNQSVTGNIFYSNSPSQKTMYHINKWYSGVDFAEFNNNKYINPWDSVSIRIFNIPAPGGSINQNYSLSQWRSIRSDDLLSTNQPYSPQSTTNDHILVYNTATSTQSVSLPAGQWRDLSGITYESSIQLSSLKSRVLYKVLGDQPPPPPPLPPAPPIPLTYQTPPSTASTRLSLIVRATALATNITVSWTSYTYTGVTLTGHTVHRKLKNATTWGNAIATLSGTATQYVDNNVAANTYYEYRVTRTASGVGTAYGYVASAIGLDPIEYRGRMVLVVDNTYTAPLSSQLAGLEADLKRDGWKVDRIDVSRTDAPSVVRGQIQAIYNTDPANVKSVLLVGRVPIYRSGTVNPDGHTAQSWVCDAYYGEMTSAWATPPTTLPSAVELGVGRIDFSNLLAFSPLTEEGLLSNYLTKLHNYKIRQFTATQDKMLIQENFPIQCPNDPFAEVAYRTAGPLVGVENITTIPTYNQRWDSRDGEGWLWGYYNGGGSYPAADGAANTTNMSTTSNNVIFNMSHGSYFGNWWAPTGLGIGSWNNNQNNLLRSTVASGNALTNVWATVPAWFFHHMGMGDPIGYSTMMTMNNITNPLLYLPLNLNAGCLSPNSSTIWVSLIGDPSLRMNYIAPPSDLNASVDGSNITFTWTASTHPGGVDGYYLYQIIDGVPTRAHPTLITGNTITGTFNSSNGTEYMVRAVKLENNRSGAYHNLSLGTTSIISANPTLSVKVFLQGPAFNATTSLMNDDLRLANLIPLEDPYPALGYTHVDSENTTTISSVLTASGPNAIVDWVVVEIRNSSDSTEKLYTIAALLQRDGDVVSNDGVSPLSIPLSAGPYYVAIRHRNHLGAMTSQPISLSTSTTLNFTTASTYGVEAMVTTAYGNMLWSGDVNFDGVIKYVGANNDRDPILSIIGGSVPTNIVDGYYSEDVNLSGSVQYTGQGNDRDPILVNIGGTEATNTKTQQLP
jgi:hypothetical protein